MRYVGCLCEYIWVIFCTTGDVYADYLTDIYNRVEVYRLEYNSGTESVVKIETTEATQAGTKGCEYEGDIIFA